MRNLEVPVSTYYVVFQGDGGGGGGIRIRFSSHGDYRMGAKKKAPPKNPKGFQQNLQKSLDQKLTPKKPMPNFFKP